MAPGHPLPIYALASWLLTEFLGALMVRSWIAGGGMRAARQRPAQTDAMSLPVLAGHAGLNLIGLICWISFVLSGATPLAWLALAFMAPAIGLGISTVAIWTPYPGGQRHNATHAAGGPAEASDPEPWRAGSRPAESGPSAPRLSEQGPAEHGPAEHGPAEHGPAKLPAHPGVMPETELRRRLADEKLTAQLVEELLSRNFAESSARSPSLSLRPLIPAGHGVLAIATFLLALLAAIAAV